MSISECTCEISKPQIQPFFLPIFFLVFFAPFLFSSLPLFQIGIICIFVCIILEFRLHCPQPLWYVFCYPVFHVITVNLEAANSTLFFIPSFVQKYFFVASRKFNPFLITFFCSRCVPSVFSCDPAGHPERCSFFCVFVFVFLSSSVSAVFSEPSCFCPFLCVFVASLRCEEVCVFVFVVFRV